MPVVAFAPLAEKDLIDIAEFIAHDKPEAARKWIDSIRTTCAMLAENPSVGELRPIFGVSGCRSFSIGQYVVFFRANAGGIEVARIIHGSRDWKNL